MPVYKIIEIKTLERKQYMEYLERVKPRWSDMEAATSSAEAL